MNHVALAKELFAKCDVPTKGLANARLAMFKMGLAPKDIVKVSQILNSL